MTVLFHSTLDDPAEWAPRLQAHLLGEEIRVWPDAGDPGTVDIALLWTQPPGGLAAYTGLRAVLSLGAGVNQLAPETLPVAVRLARLVDPGLCERMTEYCLLAVLRHYRGFDVFGQAQREGAWSYRLPEPRQEYRVGVMGLGELGGSTARRLVANGFPVRGWTRLPHTIEGVECHAGAAALPAFLDGLRALICLLPLTAETEGILLAALFARLPPGAVLINAGRGAHLVEEDLVAALDSGRLAGATLDVFRQETPPANHLFWTHPRVLMTPHVASVGDPVTGAALLAENIRRARSGAPLLCEMDRARAY